MTGRYDLPLHIFEKCKKEKIEISGQKILNFLADYSKNGEKKCFLGYCDSNVQFYAFFKKPPEYIDPSGHFIFYVPQAFLFTS